MHGDRLEATAGMLANDLWEYQVPRCKAARHYYHQL